MVEDPAWTMLSRVEGGGLGGPEQEVAGGAIRDKREVAGSFAAGPMSKIRLCVHGRHPPGNYMLAWEDFP